MLRTRPLPAPQASGRAARDEDVLAALPVGVLLLDSEGQVKWVNRCAAEIFSPLRPVGLSLRALLTLCGASGGNELIATADAGEAGPPSRVALLDGRTFDARSAPYRGGDAVISLLDVTDYVSELELAGRDALTGLDNRSGLFKRLEDHLAAEKTASSPAALLYLDLDRFKEVNDTLGHPIGDALLVKVAERLRSAVHQGDLVARFGGDEFAILQSGLPQPNSAEVLAGRLVDLLGRTYTVSGHAVNIGASVGIAVSPGDGDDPETLLKHADQALYRAKGDGRGVFRFFQDSMDAKMQARRLLEIDLRRALAMKQLALVYQPQIELESGSPVGFEALIRWHHPVRKVVSPAEFIPLAEEIGLIPLIGEWVLRAACTEAASWPVPASVAVNVSPLQFRGGKLARIVESALAASGLDPSRLDLEVTEGVFLDGTDGVLETLKTLKGLGVRISMDDFGTGYSSLGYLQKFPFDKIKIDQSFVRGAEGGNIVRAIAALGASLGMRTVAEGVETAEQLAEVRAAGCTHVQGYLTGRPVPSAELAAVFRSWTVEGGAVDVAGPLSTGLL